MAPLQLGIGYQNGSVLSRKLDKNNTLNIGNLDEQMSALQAGHRDPLNERPLRQKKQYDNWHGDHGRHRHQRPPLAFMVALKLLQRDRERILTIVLKIN